MPNSNCARVGLALAAAASMLLLGHHTAQAACSKKKTVQTSRGKPVQVNRVSGFEKKLGGKVLMGKKSFSFNVKSASQHISKARANSKKELWEDKKKKEWKVFFLAVFKKPLDDLSVDVKIWDVTKGTKRYLASIPQFMDIRCETNYYASFVLKREDIGVNKEILVTVENRGRTLAQGKLKLRGEADKFTGKADFSDEAVTDDDEPEVPDTPEEEPPPEEELEPLPGQEKVDYNDPSYLEGKDLSPTDGFEDDRPPEQTKKKGCGGCTTDGGNSAGGLVLFGLVALGLRRRRRR